MHFLSEKKLRLSMFLSMDLIDLLGSLGSHEEIQEFFSYQNTR